MGRPEILSQPTGLAQDAAGQQTDAAGLDGRRPAGAALHRRQQRLRARHARHRREPLSQHGPGHHGDPRVRGAEDGRHVAVSGESGILNHGGNGGWWRIVDGG